MSDRELLTALGLLGVSVAHGSKVYVVIVEPAAVRPRRRRRRPWVVPGDPRVAQACAFFDELMAGPSGAALPCASSDLYAWYRAWCARSQAEALAANKFSHALTAGGRVAVRRKRYLAAHGAVRQQNLLFRAGKPDWAHGPDGLRTLGHSVDNFKWKMRKYAKGVT